MTATALIGVVHAQVAGSQYTAGGGSTSGLQHAALVTIAVFAAGLIFHRIVAPLLRATLHLVEHIVALTVELGLTLRGVGALSSVAAIGYLLHTVHSATG